DDPAMHRSWISAPVLAFPGRANQQHGPFLDNFFFEPHEPGVITVVANVDYYIRESWKKLFPVSNVAQCWSDRSALRSGRSSTRGRIGSSRLSRFWMKAARPGTGLS